MMRKLLTGVFVVGLAGCQSVSVPSLFPQPAPPPVVVVAPPVVVPAPSPSEPLVWGRKDCQRAANNPAIQASFGSDKSTCERQTNMNEGDSASGAMIACMERRGYSYRTRAEHDNACARTPPRRASSTGL